MNENSLKDNIILIADDNPKNIQLLFNTLKEFGLRIIIAKNGKEVFKRINNIIPDLILLDVMMPEMDGFETCKKLKNTDMTKDIPIIFMTASDAMEDKAKGFNLGAVDYITKPFQHDEVLSRIKVHLTIKQLQNELLQINKNLEQKVIERTKALSQSEEHFRQTLNFLPIGYCEIDNFFNLTYINKAGLMMIGYDNKLNSNDILFKKIDFNSNFVESDKARENFNNILNKKIDVKNDYYDYTIINDNNEKNIIRSYLKPIIINNETVGIKSVFLNITEQKKMENEIRKSLSEKEILLRELYHRTKNNMNVISSFLQLQNIYNPNANLIDVIDNTVRRIHSMSLAHQKLYESQNLSKIAIDNYIKDLVNNIIMSSNFTLDNVKINFNLKKIDILIDIAVPIGLVINEIITNTFKYAFPDNRKGNINIKLDYKNEKRIQLVINDDGVGLKDDINFEELDTLGFKLIKLIIKKQLLGDVKVESINGLTYIINFSNTLYHERV